MFETPLWHWVGKVNSLQRRSVVITLGLGLHVDTMPTAASSSYVGINSFTSRGSALWASFGEGGAEATNVGRIAVAVCIVSSTILAFFDAEYLRADLVP